MRQIPLVLAALALCSALAACSPLRAAQRDLDDHRRLWDMNGIEDYRYNLQVICFCPSDLASPVVIQVHNGTPSSITYQESGLPNTNPILLEHYATVERLFDLIQEAIRSGADELTSSYDEALGHPTQISIDYSRNAVDDEIRFTITGFEILR